MSILSFQMNAVGQANDGLTPRLGRLNSSDTLATVSAAGYLNSIVQSQSIAMYNSDFVLAKCSDQSANMKVTVSNGSVTLAAV